LVEANWNAIAAVKSAPCPEGGRQADRARRVVGQQARDLALRDGRLDDGGQREPEHQRPQDLPEHAERERESVDDQHVQSRAISVRTSSA
jgi:hypothetical protein